MSRIDKYFSYITILATLTLFGWSHFVYRQNMVIKIHAFDSIATIPNSYIYDLKRISSGSSFWSSDDGRVLVGERSELKPDFWEWVKKATVSKEEKCGIQVIDTSDNKVASYLFFNDANYMFFAGVPREVVENTLTSICENRKHFNK